VHIDEIDMVSGKHCQVGKKSYACAQSSLPWLRLSARGNGSHCSPGLFLPADRLRGYCGGVDSAHSHFLLLDRKLNAGLAEPPLNLLM